MLGALALGVQAAPVPKELPTVTPIEEPEFTTAQGAGKTLDDTIWIADWTFDAPEGGCTGEGWVTFDERVLNDGTNFWSVSTDYDGAGNGAITGAAAVLRKHDLCWPSPDGYGNNWDYSIILNYADPSATLSFKFIGDSEPGFDFIRVEADSLGLSEARIDYAVDLAGVPGSFRDILLTDDGNNTAGITVANLLLAYSPEDGDYPSAIQAALAIDNVVVTGGLAYDEDFEAALDSNVSFANTSVATPFGNWSRLYEHISDNHKCTENRTCAWLLSDPTLLAYFNDMAFGPGGFVVRSWLDLTIVSPWASLGSTPGANTTILSFRRFPGSRLTQGGIVQNWRVRGKTRIENTDTSAPGDSVDCVSPWGHSSMFNALSTFEWVTAIFNATAFFDASSREVQFSFRVSDWRYLTDFRPATINPGPGPYTDRVRIGRRTVSGPGFDLGVDTRYQGSDNFASTVNAITPGVHYSPSIDRFGTADFRQGADQGTNFTSTRIVSGDSVTANVLDTRLTGGITSVRWYGAIASGPHAGKAPAPYTVGANGFFEVTPDSARNRSGVVVANRWFVDLDDSYLRGGDVLVYFWCATDAGGGLGSAPEGLTVLPASVAAAEAATRGLFELTCLPTIDWAPAYLARIAADTHGDLAPTPTELLASSQRSCILYYQHVVSSRRSGSINKTSFMRTLDALGYGGDYDVFDPQGYGNTNNQLASRATTAQCTGYQLIIEDDGRSNLTPNIPDGANIDTEKVLQATFYRNWLDAAFGSEARSATLWILGENTAAEFPTNTLFTSYCGAGSVVQDQALSLVPEVLGSASFAFELPSGATSFVGDRFQLNGGCPSFRRYDGYTAAGAAVATHVYRAGATVGRAAVLMNARPNTRSNTILMGFAWSDIIDPSCTPPGCPNPTHVAPKVLMAKILACTVSPGCVGGFDPSAVPDQDELDAPAVSALHPNVPNPFNPTTAITFDLAHVGRVQLSVFDVAGRVVRTLVDANLDAGRNHRVVWDGQDDAGSRVSAGVYFYRLVAGDLTATRKMIVLR